MPHIRTQDNKSKVCLEAVSPVLKTLMPGKIKNSQPLLIGSGVLVIDIMTS